MATKITKAEFDILPEALKTKFEVKGDEYELIEADVSGLKKNKDDILAELAEMKRKYGDIDPDKARAAMEAAQKAEHEDLAAKGKWEELEAKLRISHADEKAALDKRLSQMFETNAEKDLRLTLAAKGVFEDEAENLSIILRSKHLKPVEDNGKTIWKSLDDTKIIDLETYVPELKTSYGKFFKADGASGSGASGSGNNNGAGLKKTATKAEVAKLLPADKKAFYEGGGEVTDFK